MSSRTKRKSKARAGGMREYSVALVWEHRIRLKVRAVDREKAEDVAWAKAGKLPLTKWANFGISMVDDTYVRRDDGKWEPADAAEEARLAAGAAPEPVDSPLDFPWTEQLTPEPGI